MPSPPRGPYEYHVRRDAPYKVLLECGHVTRLRDRPWREDSHYACKAALGCGYTLAWVAWIDGVTGQSGKNGRQPEKVLELGDREWWL